jgi:hypothetical protein
MNRPHLLQVNFDTTLMRGIMDVSRQLVEGTIQVEEGSPPLDRTKALANSFHEANVFKVILQSMGTENSAHGTELKTLMLEVDEYLAWAAHEIAKDAKARGI